MNVQFTVAAFVSNTDIKRTLNALLHYTPRLE